MPGLGSPSAFLLFKFVCAYLRTRLTRAILRSSENMSVYRNWGSSEEHEPVTWIRGYPVYATHFIVLVYVVLMIVVAVMGRSADAIYAALGFNSVQVLSGQVWRIASYGLFNPPSLFFAIDMVMLVWFGRELEKMFGRRKFFGFYGGVYLVPSLVLTLIGLLQPTSQLGQPGALAVFVGFATLYPGAMMLFNLMAKWVAIILVALYALIHLSERNWIGFTLLASTCGYAFLFVRIEQGVLAVPDFRFWKRKPRLRVLPDLPAQKHVVTSKGAAEDATMAEVDALLDKIAKSGISSLTAKERAKLEAAREGLMKRSADRR
jgi:membrane associated rhomboid family serine protease